MPRLTGFVLAGMLLAGSANAQQRKQQEIDLQAAIRTETVSGDLKGAIKQYEAIVATYAKDRAIAARALVQMAECYQKMGNAESRKIYERVVRDYADQNEAVTTARARLGENKTASSGEIRVRRVWWGEKVSPGSSVSPDGRYVSFVDWNTGGDLAIHDLTSGTDRQLTRTGDTGGIAAMSVFSPDGKKIAYAWRNQERRFDLRLIDVSGLTLPKVLYDNPEVSTVAPCSWSPDGKSIAVELARADKTMQIGLVSATDGSLRVLKSVDWRGTNCAHFSPDGKFLAYDVPSSQESQHRDVFVLAADGSREIPAVIHSGNDIAMGWSADGKYLLFTSDRTGSLGLWSLEFKEGQPHGSPRRIKSDMGPARFLGVTPRDGSLYFGQGNNRLRDIYVASVDFDSGRILSKPHLIAEQFIGKNGGGDWSRDGKDIVYNSRRVETGTERQVLVIRSLQSGQTRELRPKLTWLYDTRWAPDGQWLISSAEDFKGRVGIYRLDPRNGEAEFICEGHSPQWSPDSEKIYFIRVDNERKENIIVERTIKSGAERTIMRSQARLWTLRISPDGQTLATRSREGAGGALLLVPVAGGESRELVRVQNPEGMGAKDLSWTPDGRFVLCTKFRFPEEHRELWAYPVAGGSPHRIDLDGLLLPEAHPDGKRIAFTVGSSDGEVWVIENLTSILAQTN